MEITFIKISDLKYLSRVVRDDGLEHEIKSYDVSRWLPHDLAHFVVEKNLKLKHGFWGCIAAGAVVPSMQLIKGKLKPKAITQSQEVLRQAGQHSNEAEVWVGFFLHAAEEKLDQNHNLFQSKLNNMWLSAKPERKTVPIMEARLLCKELRELNLVWQSLGEGESLTFKWV